MGCGDAQGAMARSPRRLAAQRRSRSGSRELARLKTQLNGKGGIPANGDWMTISARSPDKQPSPPKPIHLAEPLLASVRVYLAHEPRAKRLAAPPAPQACHADVVSSSAREEVRGIDFSALARNDLNNNASRRRAMPSAAELLQRQPLLARAKPPPDDSDADADAAPRADFVVEIPPGAAREERYPKEVWKTIVAFVFLFLCVCVNMMSLSLVHERLPDRNSTAPLPDVVLDNVAPRDWGLAVSEYLIMACTTTAMLVVVFHKHRFIVARRVFFIIGLLYLYRSATMFVTVLPVSSTTYFCSPKSNGTTPLLIVRRMFYLISGFGLSINGKHTYCGDYIYSGHTMVLVLSYLIVAEYSPRKLWPVHWALWGAGALGVGFVLLAHGHYTVDVLIAYYITTRLFWTFHALLGAQPRAGPGAMLQREWWFALFTYLERNVRGPVPRRYDWPLPWPRSKLFSRLS
ncbi:phosphatidylcholine:ceramide cholinephosphotransferase 2-like isoform X1 [Maniola hyperantus]|uniref:phosphatidylcholine:ceramide cholinephosphotransferase 2-like isoform X1 n=2 Tax=Aphantopus hyperantus TaxID=2795564 RepID=UPI0037478522